MILIDNHKFTVTGTLIWYYYICHREVWLIAHQLEARQDNPFLELGRFLQEQSYQRERKSVRLENVEIDLIKRQDGEIVVAEVKKSSRFEKSAIMQLAFYLKLLQEYGITARGELRFPKEKKRVVVELTPDRLEELQNAEADIRRIIALPKPPLEQWIPMCRNCAYREFCWS
ncbi:MAG: CRISPR-associated protein Cas4 [Calditrichaeota bacterium]|nr:CRISPR-associated protein Cas4 [Calditrichota bacterium]